MRIVVTGGCGFIGTNFIRLLLAERPNATIINVDKLTYAGNPANLADIEKLYGKNRYKLEIIDIIDSKAIKDLFKTQPVDAIVHFAAESHVDRSISDASPFIMTNVLGTHVLLEAARAAGVPRFVHVSTDEVYGSLGPTGLFTETTPLAPNSPYAASKASSDLLVRAFHQTHNMDTVTTRCSNNYGPYQFPEKLIPLMFHKALHHERLPVYGDGLQVRDWIHVQDHCRGILLALEKGVSGAVYNFGGHAERTNIDVVTTMLKLLDRPMDLINYVQDRPGHDRRYAMDYTLAEKELGYAPQQSFEEGLRDTVTWYQNNAAWFEQVQSGAYRAFMDTWYGERQ